MRALAIQVSGMLTKGGFNVLGIQAMKGITDGIVGGSALPPQMAEDVQALTVGVHKALDLSVGGRTRDHGQDAKQQQVTETIHPALRSAVIRDS